MAHIVLLVLVLVTPDRVERAERAACERVEARRNPSTDHDEATCAR